MDLPVSTMTTAQKLEAMEQLWTSLRADANYTPPEWHREVLAERQRKMNSGESTFSTLDEVRERIDRARR